MKVNPELCVIHLARQAVEEGERVCWEYDGVRECVYLTPAEILLAAMTLPGVETHRVSIGDDGKMLITPFLLFTEATTFLLVPVDVL